MLKTFRKHLSKRFNDACKEHDLSYQNQNLSREQVDDQLLTSMLVQSQGQKDAVLAFVFFVAVRLFGWITWYRNKVRDQYKKSALP